MGDTQLMSLGERIGNLRRKAYCRVLGMFSN
jgi:hypothetical protein